MKSLAHQNDQEPITVAGYARVSSRIQQKRESIKTQVEQIQRCCETQGWHLEKIYMDEARSGTLRFDQRPSGRQLLVDARQGRFTLVVVADFDRLGREGEVSYVAKNLLSNLGVGLYGIAEGIAVSAPSGGLIFGIRTALAEEARKQLLIRSYAGRLRAVREGKWVGGRAPFGYKIVGRRLEVAEDDAQIVRRIFTLAVKRNSTVTIADRLNREGLRTRLGGQWRFNHVARLLHTTVYYTGEYVWGRKEQVTQQVPEIVNKDLWEKAQEALQLNRKDNPGNSKRDYLLRSLIKCGFCNRSMVGMAFGGQDRRAYRCTAKLKASLAPHCPSRYIPLEKIESLVWNQLSDWILRREDIERVLAESLREYEAQRQEWALVLAQARTDLEMKDRERDRILTLYRKGLIGDADIEQQLREIEREKDVLTRTAAEIARYNLDEDMSQIAAPIRQKLEQFRSAIKQGTVSPKTKRRILEQFVESVTVHLKKGSPLHWTVREVMPFRPNVPRDLQENQKTTVWVRNAAAKQEPEARVVVCYRFPWPSLDTALGIDVITSH